MDFDSALLALRTMLSESLTESLELKAGAESFRLQLETWQAEALNLSSELKVLKRDSEGQLSSLTDSLRREAAAREAAEDRARLDAEALEAEKRRSGLLTAGVAVATGVTLVLTWLCITR